MAASVAVIGGGLAGLACGALLARSGAHVRIFEGGEALGGMAATQDHQGYLWNWGGHALYRKGPGVAVLRGLGVRPHGFAVRAGSSMEALRQGEVRPAPFSPKGMFGGLLGPREQVELARLFAAAGGARTDELGDVTLAEWLDRYARHPNVRETVLALVRLTTFGHNPGVQSADGAVHQLWRSLGGVWYLHGGWQQLVDGLRAAAVAAGASVSTGARVAAVEHDTAVRAVRLAGGRRIPVTKAVVAVGSPRRAAKLLDGDAAEGLEAWAARAVPVRAATWELSLRRQPPGSVWVLGLDTPIYINVHSHFADVAPPGGAMVHVVHYVGADDPDPLHRADMAQALDRVLPGWREELIEDRFLPSLTVMHDHPAASNGGLAGRPRPLVPGVEGLAIAGDWVGGEGLLADAALASAAAAARDLMAGVRVSSQALV